MSTTSASGRAPTQATPRGDVYGSERGSGWIAFAGTMLVILGVMNVIYGVAAIDDANVYVGDAKYVFADLNTWGWFLLIVGVIQFFAAFSIWNHTSWGRWVGVLSAACNSILQLLFLPAFPFLALSLFTLNILVIYGLIAYGGRQGA